MKLGLGTVQLGMPYGLAGRQVAAQAARAILDEAVAAGLRTFDTAAAYGDAEALLGAALPPRPDERLVTKLPPLPDGLVAGEVRAWVRASCEQSLRRLRRPRVHAVLVHRVADLFGERAAALRDALEALRRDGWVQGFGASVYEGWEIDALLERQTPDLVQLPLSLFDQRLIAGGQLERMQRAGVEIHARSLLLQGVLAMAPDALPAHLHGLAPGLTRLQAACRQAGVTVVQAALGFVAQLPAVDCALLGVNSVSELHEAIEALQVRLPPDWYAALALDEPALLNPSRWLAPPPSPPIPCPAPGECP